MKGLVKTRFSIAKKCFLSTQASSGSLSQDTIVSENQSSDKSSARSALGFETNEPIFQTIGSPPTLLLIKSPASAPVTIKRNSILSLNFPTYITKPNQLINIDELVKFELNYYNSFFKFNKNYQNLISTVPFNLIINTDDYSNSGHLFNKKLQAFKTFHNLKLDGTSDWAIFKNNAIQAYSGNNLSLSLRYQPNKVSRQLQKKLDRSYINAKSTSFFQRIFNKNVSSNSDTGLSRFKKFTFISGRGNVGLVGSGEILQIDLTQNESILVNKNHLLGLKINGIHDLNNLIYTQKKEIITDKVEKSKSKASENKLKSETEKPKKEIIQIEGNSSISSSASAKTFLKLVDSVSIIFRKTWSSVGRFSGLIINYLKTKNSDSSNFVTILGPTTILLNSSSNQSNIIKSNKKIHIDQEMTVQSEDMLSYVTINNGKVNFENTKDFNDTVKQIESKH